MHGGKSPVGIAHPSTRHGRYSRDLPTRLVGKYEAAISDSELISVREEVGLVDARVSELLGRLDSKESASHWLQLKGLVERFRSGDPSKRQQAAEDLSDWSTEALTDYAVWGEVLDLVERRRKLADTESKRLAATGQMMAAERVMLLVGALVDIVRRHVSDRDQLTAISREVGQLVDLRPRD